MRLWKKDAFQARDPRPVKQGGDYIAPDEYTLSEFGGQGTRTWYAEVVKPSAGVGDLHIEVSFHDANANGSAQDSAPLTGVDIGFAPVALNGTIGNAAGSMPTSHATPAVTISQIQVTRVYVDLVDPTLLLADLHVSLSRVESK